MKIKKFIKENKNYIMVGGLALAGSALVFLGGYSCGALNMDKSWKVAIDKCVTVKPELDGLLKEAANLVMNSEG